MFSLSKVQLEWLPLMDVQWLIWLYGLVSCGLLYFFIDISWRRKKMGFPLPPGPPGLPIVGNLFQLGTKPNESLSEMAQQYGPLMTISLGMKTTVVISSSAMAKEFFKTHDQNFAGRVVLEAATALSHHKSSIVFSQYGPYWRKIRRIATTQLFTPNRLQALQHLRRDQMFRSIRSVFENRGKSLNVSSLVFYLGLNLLSNMIFSTSLFDPNNPESEVLRDALMKAIETVGTPNVADFFPFLGFLDPQRLKRKTAIYLGRVCEYLDSCINERLAARRSSICSQQDTDKDFLDILLDSTGDDFTLRDIRAVIFELFSGGSDTSATAIEWAMTELINNPHIMKQAQEELKDIVGLDRKVEESDLNQLPYLQAVVKEVFRLHPPLPFTVPHRADSSCEVGGYSIPKNTQVIANIWAIARNPADWKDPSKFMPERFLSGENSKMEYKGHDFELIPFGAGRRICLGLPLAERMVPFTIASLIHSFDWTVHGGQLDMTETLRIALRKTLALHALPTPRLPTCMY